MTKNQSEVASIRQREEMVKRVLVVAELLAKGSEATVINPKKLIKPVKTHEMQNL